MVEERYLMGNVTISTSETEIYYPSDWLIDGGPPPETMSCPNFRITDENAMSMLSIIWEDFGQNQGRWVVLAGDGEVGERFVVMHSTNYKDVATYFSQYMERLERWLQKP
jgi:hypothetical protein